MRRVQLAVTLACALAFGGCGGSGEQPRDVLAETASRLGEIRSGTLDMSLLVVPHGQGGESGFELRGPFAFRRSGALPVMKIEYTQVTDGERASVTLLSTGRHAYAVVRGQAYRLGAEQTGELRSTSRALAHGGLPELPLADWIVDARLTNGGGVGGADTDRVRGRVDVVAAVNDLLELVRSFGGDLPRLDGRGARQLKDATRSTLFDLHTGKDDRLLRRLRMEADFGLDVPAGLRARLGDLVGARVAFRLAITDPNEPVSVAAPTAARPASELG